MNFRFLLYNIEKSKECCELSIDTNLRREAKKALGINPKHRHILVMDNSLPLSELKDLLDLLYICADETIEISVFCKGDEEYERVIRKDFANLSHFHIWGAEKKAAELIAGADLLVTRPESSVLCRARESQTPLVLTSARTITEKIFRYFYTDSGSAVYAETDKGISEVCMELLNNPKKLQRMSFLLS